jgi:hypothetical protein
MGGARRESSQDEAARRARCVCVCFFFFF